MLTPNFSGKLSECFENGFHNCIFSILLEIYLSLRLVADKDNRECINRFLTILPDHYRYAIFVGSFQCDSKDSSCNEFPSATTHMYVNSELLVMSKANNPDS